jgi:predicted ATPase
MTATNKTPLDHVNDTLAQLKEMRHYAKNNVEHLTAQWLLFDGELKQFKQADRVEDLMTRQSEFHDALDAEISELEDIVTRLQPAADEGSPAPPAPH